MVGRGVLVCLRIKNKDMKLSLVFLLVLSWFFPFPGFICALFLSALIFLSQGPYVSDYLLVVVIISAAGMVQIRD